MSAISDLRERLAEVADLHNACAALDWDKQVVMPPRGAPARGEMLATLQRIAHDRFASDETGRLIDAAAREVEGLPDDSVDASMVRVARRDWEKERRVPGELRAEMARTSVEAFGAWAQARERSDWELFRPHLARQLELKRRYVECFDDVDCAYDAVLDDFEPEATTAEVAAVFERLKQGLIPLIAAVAQRADAVDDSCLYGDFPEDRQEQLVRRVIRQLGFDPEGWRLDRAVHPFATSVGAGDVRITTRYHRDDLHVALLGALHETGHGLYEAGSAAELHRTILAGGASLGLHESQSRLWENMVGRSRPFSRWLVPKLREAFPDGFADLDPERHFRAINRVQPSPIRVEADETTYSMHVILRFELEQDMLEGRVDLDELPEAWNARMREYLGIDVRDDAEGVLQDVHWSLGMVGYFPTYALGNVMAAQIWAVARAALPDLDAQIEAGELGPLRDWLGERLYRHGRKFTPAQTLRRAIGTTLDPEPYLEYLSGKVGELYGVTAAA